MSKENVLDPIFDMYNSTFETFGSSCMNLTINIHINACQFQKSVNTTSCCITIAINMFSLISEMHYLFRICITRSSSSHDTMRCLEDDP